MSTLKVVVTDYAMENLDCEREVLAPLGCRLDSLKDGKGADVAGIAATALRGEQLPNIVNGVPAR